MAQYMGVLFTDTRSATPTNSSSDYSPSIKMNITIQISRGKGFYNLALTFQSLCTPLCGIPDCLNESILFYLSDNDRRKQRLNQILKISSVGFLLMSKGISSYDQMQFT